MRKGLFITLIVLFALSACAVSGNEIITSDDFEINENGNLIFRGTDLGRVKGNDGKDGLNGVNGIDGKDGLNGKNGIDGKDGLNGVKGNDGKDGTNIIQPEFFRYIDLSKYNIGDSIPIDTGEIPFTWVLEDSRWIKIDEVSLKLINKINIEDSKSDISKRLYNTYYPYLLELKVSGSASLEMIDTHNIVVIFNDESVRRGSGSEINADGTFEIIEQFGEHNYNILIFSSAFFEVKPHMP